MNMRNLIITFSGVLWIVYILAGFVLADFNFFNWSIQVRFVVGFFAVIVGLSVGLAVAGSDEEE